MEDTANKKGIIKKIAQDIEDLKGIDTIAIDISAQSSWADFFIISSVTSSTHLKGILKQLQSKLDEYGIEPLWRHKKIDNDKWVLIDCGDLIIHLMDKQARDFYELEKLWFNGEIIYQSSKSS